MRWFNVTGICRPDDHYMLPPLPRLPTVRDLIDRKHYFVLHAPRQVGKSTALHIMAQTLTAEGRYAAVLLSVEPGVAFSDDVGAAERAILRRWRSAAEVLLPKELQPPPWPKAPPGARLGEALKRWSEACPRPLVVFIDEIDALSGELLISVLRQMREGFTFRPGHFPWSLCLCGMRDVRDYKIASGGSERLNTASPFNIKAESLTLANFSRDDIAALYGQHTAETGQPFEPAAIDRVFALTAGQPWLVNALALQAVDVLVQDRARPITAADIDAAKELLIQRRDTHLDSLAERLREPRVRRVIDPILAGLFIDLDMMNDDLIYVRALGLIRTYPTVAIANRIYQELIPRALTFVMQINFPQQGAWYLRPDGTLDLPALLAAFQRFFAENSEAWLGRFDYQEAGPHLMLMAFLQRIVNGGGSIAREFALGSGRAGLMVSFAGQRHALELKVRRDEGTVQQGIEQLSAYLDSLGLPGGTLVVFDQRKRPWAEKLYHTQATGPGGQAIEIYGM